MQIDGSAFLMKRVTTSKLAVLIFALFVSASVHAKRTEEPPPINFVEIQQGVMSFADSWIGLTGQGFGVVMDDLDDPQMRLEIRRMRYRSMSGAVDIATGPYPGFALLDMMVFASLSRATWDRVWPQRYPESGRQLAATFEQLESEIWAFGAAYLDADQRAETRALVNDWLARNPETEAASFVRFSDFGSLGRSPRMQRETSPGGLLSPVRDAAAAATAIQETSERAMYLAFRMQNLMAERAELTLDGILARDDITTLLRDVSGFREVAEEYARLMDDLPADVERLVSKAMIGISAEREATITQAMTALSAERETAIEQLARSVTAERQAALEQVLGGIQGERNEMMGLVLDLVIYTDLQAKATFARIFVLSACLILLYFLLRLVYRYMRGREQFNFQAVVATIVLLFLSAAAIAGIGVMFVEISKPDLERIQALQQKLEAAKDELEAQPPDAGSP